MKRKIFARSVVQLIMRNKSHDRSRKIELLRRSSVIFDLQCSDVGSYWFGACELSNIASLCLTMVQFMDTAGQLFPYDKPLWATQR